MTCITISCAGTSVTGVQTSAENERLTRFSVDSLITDETGAFEARSGFNADGQKAAYYGRGDVTNGGFWGNAQRALCNKCHVQD